MVRSLLKSLFLFSTLAASVILAAPAPHNHPVGRSSEPSVAGGVSRREDLPSSHPWAAGLTAPASIAAGKRSEGVKEDATVEKRVTNAMRIANGLPPLVPRKLYHGSKSGSAHRPRTSPSLRSGSAILIYDSNGRSGNLLGYVSKSFNGFGDYSLTNDCTAAMLNPQLLSGGLTNPAKPGGYSNVGFVSFDNPTFSTNSYDYAYMGGTAATPTGSPPVTSTQHSDAEGSNFYIEGNVWSLGADNELVPTWINPDGTQAHTEIGYVPGAFNSIVITGSLSTFRGAFGDTAGTVQIRLFFANQFTCAI